MTVTLYDVTVPVFIRSLSNLSAVLQKGAAHLGANKDLDTLRLAPDMKPLVFQIQTATATAKNTIGRLAPEAAVPTWEDSEKSFDDLQRRLATAIELLKSIDRAHIDGKEDAQVVLPTMEGEKKLKGLQMVQSFALPNFFFHVVTAYAILRNAGVQIGKGDYLRGNDA